MNPQPVIDFAQATCKGFQIKADKKKHASERLFIVVIVCSLTVPLLIAYGGDCRWLAKIIPSILTIVSAGLTSWLQLRNPQKLWSIYRNAQRQIEDHITRYNYKIGEYHLSATPDALLAERVAHIAISAHNEWTEILPNSNTSIVPQIVSP
jgi:hypothetical protein